MALLEFDLAAVRKLCEHAMAAPEHSRAYEDLANNPEPGRPGLILVGDQGVYLMSNGKPGLMEQNGKTHIVVYADGINPHTDDFEDWWARKNACFGGDDGAEYLPWAAQVIEMADQDPGATRLQIEISEDKLEIVGVA